MELPWSPFFAVPRIPAHEDSPTLERVLELAPLSSSDNAAHYCDEAHTPPNLIPHITYSNKNSTSNHTDNTSAHKDLPHRNQTAAVSADLEAHIQGTSEKGTTDCNSVVPTPLSEFPNQTHVDQVEL